MRLREHLVCSAKLVWPAWVSQLLISALSAARADANIGPEYWAAQVGIFLLIGCLGMLRVSVVERKR
jgi:hypothetical protein